MTEVESELRQRFALLRETVVAVGEGLEAARRGQVAVRRKDDQTWVSRADEDAERALREMIARNFPGDRVIGEEGGVAGAASAAFTWVVDPLDGTSNYLAGTAEYAVAAAILGPGGRNAAVVHLPATGAQVSCVAGGPLDQTGFVRPPSTARSRLLLGVGFAGSAEVRARQLAELHGWLTLPAEVREVGSASVSLARVAAGQYDGYCELGLPVWDVLPGVLLAAAAGCHVLAPAGFGALPRHESSHVLVVASRAMSVVDDWRPPCAG